MRRGVRVVVGVIAVSVYLGGCAFDAAHPEMKLANDSSQDVVVIVEDASGEYPRALARESRSTLGVSECWGTGIRVETASGDLLGRVDAEVCPNWTLTIRSDGSLDYVETK